VSCTVLDLACSVCMQLHTYMQSGHCTVAASMQLALLLISDHSNTTVQYHYCPTAADTIWTHCDAVTVCTSDLFERLDAAILIAR
jgi:hypothetical protein